LKVFCPLFIVMACRMFWTDLFANLWQRAEPLNSKSDRPDQLQKLIDNARSSHSSTRSTTSRQ
jgi:hypothetical protein